MGVSGKFLARPKFYCLFRALRRGTAAACEGLFRKQHWRTTMPLFLLPYFYMQLALSGSATTWTAPTAIDDLDE
jgi:hypothetical protein